MSETRIVRRARFQPLFHRRAQRLAVPHLVAHRSKYTMNESAVMPIATIRPAIADSYMVKFWYRLSNTTDR